MNFAKRSTAQAPDSIGKDYPTTLDGRYFVVRGRLWRRSDPHLAPLERAQLVTQLMSARRAVAAAKKQKNKTAIVTAHANVDRVKKALGERGAVWWTDGAPDYNRHLVKNTPYAVWYKKL